MFGQSLLQPLDHAGLGDGGHRCAQVDGVGDHARQLALVASCCASPFSDRLAARPGQSPVKTGGTPPSSTKVTGWRGAGLAASGLPAGGSMFVSAPALGALAGHPLRPHLHGGGARGRTARIEGSASLP